MNKQLTAEAQLSNALGRFEERVKGTGFILWCNIFKKKLSEILSKQKAKDKAIYGELMQIETLAKECEPSEASAKLIQKIQKLKGVVGTVCLCLLFLNVAQFSFNGFRNRTRDNQARITRIVRKGEDNHG